MLSLLVSSEIADKDGMPSLMMCADNGRGIIGNGKVHSLLSRDGKRGAPGGHVESCQFNDTNEVVLAIVVIQ